MKFTFKKHTLKDNKSKIKVAYLKLEAMLPHSQVLPTNLASAVLLLSTEMMDKAV